MRRNQRRIVFRRVFRPRRAACIVKRDRVFFLTARARLYHVARSLLYDDAANFIKPSLMMNHASVCARAPRETTARNDPEMCWRSREKNARKVLFANFPPRSLTLFSGYQLGHAEPSATCSTLFQRRFPPVWQILICIKRVCFLCIHKSHTLVTLILTMMNSKLIFFKAKKSIINITGKKRKLVV